MDKESVLQKRNRAEHSSLLIVSAGFLLLCTCEVFGIITGKLWIGQREIVFGGTLFFIMFLSQFALNLKYYLIILLSNLNKTSPNVLPPSDLPVIVLYNWNLTLG